MYAHNDDMGLGAIEAIEAAGLVPGVDMKIVTVDAVKDGMQALADGKINFIVECSPLLGKQLVEIVKTLNDGGTVEQRIITEETTFDAGAGDRGAARPPVLSSERADAAASARSNLGGCAESMPRTRRVLRSTHTPPRWRDT